MRYIFVKYKGRTWKLITPLNLISTSAAGDTFVLRDILTKSPWLLRSSRLTRGSSRATSELHLRQSVTLFFFPFPGQQEYPGVTIRFHWTARALRLKPVLFCFPFYLYFFFRESWTLLVKSNSPSLHEKSNLWWISLKSFFGTIWSWPQ